jgi:hypothetical protein
MTVRRINLKLQNIVELFHSSDSAPFRKTELDPSAEEWIVASATEAPRGSRLELHIDLPDPAKARQSLPSAQEAVRSFFARKSQHSRRQLSKTLKNGRTSLLIGLGFLGLTLTISKILGAFEQNRMATLLRESLIVAGWVAMWRPLEFLLYDWWPIRKERLIFDSLSRLDVVVPEQTEERGDESSQA